MRSNYESDTGVYSAVMRALIVLALVTAACSGSTSTSPSPAPTPARVTGTITSTTTGQRIGSFVQSVNGLPAQITVAHPGYVTRQTWVSSATPTVDLIPEAGFDLAFYRQFARGAMDGRTDPLRTLTQAPSIFMEAEGVKGLNAAVAARLEVVARRTIQQLTGGRFQLARWETGPTPRARQAGWIMVERKDEEGLCGSALIGASAGQIYLSGDGNRNGCNLEAVFAHELGHAFGFWHVEREGSLMFKQQRSANLADTPTDHERHHAAIAYARKAGNMDVDSDPQTGSGLSAPHFVVD